MSRPLRLAGLLGSLAMAVLLLVAQQGLLLHQLSHARSALAADGGAKHPAADEPCELCHAFAHIGSATTVLSASPSLLTDLAFERHSPAIDASVMPAWPVPRSRGPPQVA